METYEINARYRFESLISAPMSPVYDDNIGCIDFETYSSDSTGKKRFMQVVGLFNVELHVHLLGNDGIENSYQLSGDDYLIVIFEFKYSKIILSMHIIYS